MGAILPLFIGGDNLSDIISARIQEAQESAGKNFADFTRSDFINQYFSRIGVSRSAFDIHKRDARKYLQSMGAYSAMDKVAKIHYFEMKHVPAFNREFFQNFDALYDALAARVTTLSKNNHKSVFDAQIAAIFLAWAGMTAESASRLFKKDVDRQGMTVTVDGKTYPIPERAMKHIAKFADSYSIIKSNRNSLCEMPLVSSPYLFRTFKSAQQTAASIMAGISSKMNTTGGKMFMYPSIRMSGIFYRALMYERQNGGIQRLQRSSSEESISAFIGKMQEIFESRFSNVTQAYQRLTQFEAYKEYFHQDT